MPNPTRKALFDALPWQWPSAEPIFAINHFEAVAPNTTHSINEGGQQKMYAEQDDRKIRPIVSVAKPEGPFLYHKELERLPREFKRGVFYSLREDSRNPLEILETGFLPNFVRPEHNEKANDQLAGNLDPTARFSNQIELVLDMQGQDPKGVRPPLPPRGLSRNLDPVTKAKYSAPDLSAYIRHKDPMALDRFLMDADLGEFISFTKSVAIAKQFATSYKKKGNAEPDRCDHEGWVYVCYLPGAIDVPRRQQYGAYTGTDGKRYDPLNEQELTWAGAVDPESVVACRKVDTNEMFKGPVFVNTWWLHKDPTAISVICSLLSGMIQGSK
jgi:hypothetical protein